MADALPDPPPLVQELRVSAHLMTLQAGVFCIYHTAGSVTPDPATGLPGARLSLPPGPGAEHVTITGFRDDGWLSGPDAAALVRVVQAPAQILMTVYMLPDATSGAPSLQVMRLSDVATLPDALPRAVAVPAVVPDGNGVAGEPEMAAHIQERGDVLARFGEWLGERGGQRWIEGFAVTPRHGIGPEEIEYQAVLGRDWLSPWSEGGQFCGSRGMALPILGLRVRLRGAALATYGLEVSGSFTDGAVIGPVGAGEACESPSLAPLAAFRITLHRLEPDVPKAASHPKVGSPSGTGSTSKAGSAPKSARPDAKKGRHAAGEATSRPKPARPRTR